VTKIISTEPAATKKQPSSHISRTAAAATNTIWSADETVQRAAPKAAAAPWCASTTTFEPQERWEVICQSPSTTTLVRPTNQQLQDKAAADSSPTRPTIKKLGRNTTTKANIIKVTS